MLRTSFVTITLGATLALAGVTALGGGTALAQESARLGSEAPRTAPQGGGRVEFIPGEATSQFSDVPEGQGIGSPWPGNTAPSRVYQDPGVPDLLPNGAIAPGVRGGGVRVHGS